MLLEHELGIVLSRIQPVPSYGPYSRCVGYHHLLAAPTPVVARPKPLWGMGAAAYGGRFTPKGTFEAVYLAEDSITSLAEVALIFRHPQAPPSTFSTPLWVHIVVEGILQSVLDLTRPDVLSQLGTTQQEITGEWRSIQAAGAEAPTQMVGRVCYQTGRFDGIRFPSSKNPPTGVCLAVFPDRLTPPAFLEVYDPHGNLAQRLP